MKKTTVLLAALLAGSAAYAQNQYDPLTAGYEIQKQQPVDAWNAVWMWHPGQLAAHLQQVNLAQSKDRCTYVGYPGNFYKPVTETTFRKEVKLGHTVALRWRASGEVTFTVDGKLVQSPVQLAKGKHTLEAAVTTAGATPALMVDGIRADGWMASADGSRWNPVEWDPKDDGSATLPDAPKEYTAVIPVQRWHLLRGAALQDETLFLQPQSLAVADFFQLELGQMTLLAKGEGELSFTFGESVEEAQTLDPKAQEQIPLEPVVLSGEPQQITLPDRGLRFVGIRSTGKTIISNVTLLAKVWPVEMQLQFDCPDPELVHLVQAGIGTQHASMHNFYLDGVKRDYLPWAMDAVVSSIGGDYAFGERQLSRNGISVGLLPDGAAKEDLGVVDYPFHALIGLWQEYMRYGDLSTARMYRSRMEGQLALYESLVDENGFISSTDRRWGFIPGWDRDEGPDNVGTPAYPQMLLYMNYRIAARFETLFGDKAAAKHYHSRADALKQSIMDYFWDASRKAFINGYRADGTTDYRLSHHTQSWAVLAGLFPESALDNLFDKVIPEMDYYKKDISYEKGYEALSYAASGRTGQFVQLLKEVWGRWLDAGHTRYPENFKIQNPLADQLSFYGRPFGLSLCHGANGAPPIIAAVFGVMGLRQNGVAEYSLEPDLIGMAWAKGRIPVSQGFIEVDLHAEGLSTVTIPAGCKLSVAGKTYSKSGTYAFSL